MRKFSIYCVHINIEKGARWKHHFINRPTIEEVLDALNEDRLLKRSGIKPDDDLGRRMAKSHFAHLTQMVEDNGLPKGSMQPCTYAGLTVGSIRVERVGDAFETADKTST